MIFIGILQSLQDFLYEIFVWIMLVPKTLLHAILKPVQTIKYVNAEHEKKLDEQFDEYLHPAFFYIAAVIMRVAIRSPYDFARDLTESGVIKYAAQDFIIFMFYLVWLEWLNKRPLKRSTLKRPFYIQCYILGAIQFAETILLDINRSGAWINYIEYAILVLIVLYEALIFREEMKINLLKAIALAVIPLVMFFVFLFVLSFTGFGAYVY